MSIQLLWVIPVIALSLVFLIMILNLQKEEATRSRDGDLKDIKTEVKEYNNRVHLERKILQDSSEERLKEIEQTIGRVTGALSKQHKIIESYKGKDEKIENEMNELKKQLRGLQNEYDMTLSENYSLRAKLRKIEPITDYSFDSEPHIVDTQILNTSNQSDSKPIERKTHYLDVKVFEKKENPQKRPHSSDLDDTSEINISGLKN